MKGFDDIRVGDLIRITLPDRTMEGVADSYDIVCGRTYYTDHGLNLVSETDVGSVEVLERKGKKPIHNAGYRTEDKTSASEVDELSMMDARLAVLELDYEEKLDRVRGARAALKED